MIAKLLTLTLALSLAAPAAALACEGEGHKVNTVNTADAGKLNKEKKATFVDANNVETRAKHGVVPGAVLLTSSAEFDPAKELPAQKDKALVFYCANTRCSASHQAAKRALESGWTNVAVMPDGISGWKEAGLPVQKQTASKGDQS